MDKRFGSLGSGKVYPYVVMMPLMGSLTSRLGASGNSSEGGSMVKAAMMLEEYKRERERWKGNDESTCWGEGTRASERASEQGLQYLLVRAQHGCVRFDFVTKGLRDLSKHGGTGCFGHAFHRIECPLQRTHEGCGREHIKRHPSQCVQWITGIVGTNLSEKVGCGQTEPRPFFRNWSTLMLQLLLSVVLLQYIEARMKGWICSDRGSPAMSHQRLQDSISSRLNGQTDGPYR